MKTKILLCGVVFIVVVLAGVCSFAVDKEKFGIFIPNRIEEFYGTWVNPKYKGVDQDSEQKMILYDWGYGEGFYKVTDNNVIDRWTFIFADKWTDKDGNIWYTVFNQWAGSVHWFTLNKISKKGTVLEAVGWRDHFPTDADFNPKANNYFIFYRK